MIYKDRESIVVEEQHDAPWWYRWLARVLPARCREIPEADNPTWCEHKSPLGTDDVVRMGQGEVGWCGECGAAPRIVLRQYAIWKRRWYLQQFACSEDARFMHSHPAGLMLVIGLWGSYTEYRISGKPIERRAPYIYVMDAGHVHHVQRPRRGHTSLFLMFGIQHDDPVGDKRYYGAPNVMKPEYAAIEIPSTRARTWEDHTRRKVERI